MANFFSRQPLYSHTFVNYSERIVAMKIYMRLETILFWWRRRVREVHGGPQGSGLPIGIFHRATENLQHPQELRIGCYLFLSLNVYLSIHLSTYLPIVSIYHHVSILSLSTPSFWIYVFVYIYMHIMCAYLNIHI